jgi:hypothetical protein
MLSNADEPLLAGDKRGSRADMADETVMLRPFMRTLDKQTVLGLHSTHRKLRRGTLWRRCLWGAMPAHERYTAVAELSVYRVHTSLALGCTRLLGSPCVLAASVDGRSCVPHGHKDVFRRRCDVQPPCSKGPGISANPHKARIHALCQAIARANTRYHGLSWQARQQRAPSGTSAASTRTTSALTGCWLSARAIVACTQPQHERVACQRLGKVTSHLRLAR